MQATATARLYHVRYIHSVPVWGVVIGCVRPDSGPEAKLVDLAGAFTELGWRCRVELVRPDKSAPRRMAAALRRIVVDAPPDRGLVLVRSHWSLPGALPSVRSLRAAGHAVVVDVPTPVAAGVREILGSPRAVWSTTGRLLTETLWTPLAWPSADLVVQYAPDAAPWGWLAAKRRLTLTNGVDVGRRPLTAHWVGRSGVTFVCAGALGPWHGLDRLVRGLAAAAGRDARLLVVGDGPELPRLQAMSAALGVSSRVRYLGSLGGAALDGVMDQADVGVASLAEHRRGGAGLSPLKTRDYLARGLPVLFAGDDPDLRGDPPFTRRLAPDDSDVDIASVATWLQGLRARATATPSGTSAGSGPWQIRGFAVDHLQWRSRAEAILAALQ